MRSALVFAIVLSVAGIAHADPEPTTPKDPRVATAFAIGGTLVGPLMIASGTPGLMTVGGIAMIVGPSAGHFYSHKYLTWGMGLRTAGVVSAGVALGIALHDDYYGGSHADGVAMGALLVGGAAAYLTGTIWDIATAGSAARDYNDAHQLTAAPTIVRGAPGFAIAGTF